MGEERPASGPFPRFRPVADHGLLVEFGEAIDALIHERVVQLDAALAAEGFEGFLEAVPAYASLLVCFDPIRTDHRAVRSVVQSLISRRAAVTRSTARREVEVCYESDLAPDLARVAEVCGLSPAAVIAAHLGGAYSVFMYGFAPGYAYLAGTPRPIQLPRKAGPVRGVPAGSVLIAGPQCLVTTLTMPTGWWVIGRSPTRILSEDASRPFLFDVGDAVTFRQIDRPTFDARTRPAR